MKNIPPVDRASKLAVPFVADHWEAARWCRSQRHAERRVDRIAAGGWQAEGFRCPHGSDLDRRKAGQRVALPLQGRIAKITICSADGGQVIITVNGQRSTTKPVPRFHSYCPITASPRGVVWDGNDPQQVHDVTVEIYPEHPTARAWRSVSKILTRNLSRRNIKAPVSGSANSC